MKKESMYKKPKKNCNNCKGLGYTIHDCVGYGSSYHSYSYTKRCECSYRYSKLYKKYLECRNYKNLLQELKNEYDKNVLPKDLYRDIKKFFKKRIEEIDCIKFDNIEFYDPYENFNKPCIEPD